MARPPQLSDLPVNVSGDYCYVTLKVHSPGFFGEGGSTTSGFFTFFTYSLPSVLLQLAAIFLLTQGLHSLLRRVLMPRLVSEILTGIILGHSGLQQIDFLRRTLFQDAGRAIIELLAKIGYIFFIFLCGVKMTPKMVLQTGTKPWFIGFLAVIIPYSVTLIWVSDQASLIPTYNVPSFQNFRTIQGLYSFPVVSTMLYELKVINSEVGRLALSAALISDFASNFVITGVSLGRLSRATSSWVIPVQSFILSVALIVIIISVGIPLCRWIIMRTPEGEPVGRGHVTIIAIALLVVFIVTDNIGLHYMYGPFILGLVIPSGPPLGSTLVDRFEPLISGLFAPLLVTYCGMLVDLDATYGSDVLTSTIDVYLITMGLKFGATMLLSVGCQVPIKAAFALGLVMSSQGVVHMSFYYQDFVNQTFGLGIFSRLIMGILIQSVVAHPVARALYDTTNDYVVTKKRDILNAGDNGLRLLFCAYRLEEVTAIRNVLENYFSTVENPLNVYALHLVELAGRAHPQLINHQLGMKSAADQKTQLMIDCAAELKRDREGCVTVEQFTAVSLTKFMHHDVCSLAYNKVANVIILPFHRKWNQQGQLIGDNQIVRATNSEALEAAPCSVGILIDRSRINRQPSATYNIGMPFLGGEDDREALAFVIRMVQSPGVCLVVIRFVPWAVNWGESQVDTIQDAEILKEARLAGQEKENVVYKEERVKDGSESALIIRDMEDVCDLIVVGRRHQDEMPQLFGLSQWNSIPELGPIGDMLAAPDLTKPLSVLVMQHQKLVAENQVD